MLAGHEAGDRVLDLGPVTDRTEMLEAIDAAHRVHASRALRDYIVALMRHTRDDGRVELGASPRAGLLLLRAAKARALIDGRDHALPDDVQALADAVLTHRIMLVPEAAGVERSAIVADAVAATPGAVGESSHALRLRLRRASGSCCCSSPARSTPSRCTSPARRSRCSASAPRAGSAPARGARRSAARSAPAACSRSSR